MPYTEPKIETSEQERDKLSIPVDVIVPFYNEPNAHIVIRRLLELPFVEKIFVVNDCSTDGSERKVESLAGNNERVVYIKNEVNLGKAEAVKRAIPLVDSPYTVLQDADLEYPVENIPKLWEMLPDYDMVVAKRFVPIDQVTFSGVIANRLITTIMGYPDVFSGQRIVKTEFLQSIDIGSHFTMETIILLEAIRANLNILWVNSLYYPRGYKEGKKVKPWHMINILLTLFKYKLFARRSGNVSVSVG
ncbi:MAG: glycosyltransferase family 2 protein [Nitrospirae bacterium]|nr:MAG: glycosyltransferase family 2 protein [Nitrospirota bacterium]